MVAALLISTVAASQGVTNAIDFMGFSRNEEVAAYRVSMLHQGAGFADSYAVICAHHTASGELVAVFKDRAPRRVSGKGRPERYPLYEHAEPASVWKQAKKSGFRAKKLPMNESIVRLQPQSDAPITATAEADLITARGAPGAPLTFGTVIRQLNRLHVGGPDFSHDAVPDEAIEAEVYSFFSSSGYNVAVLAVFETPSGGRRSKLGLVRLGSPVATYNIGTFSMAMESLKMNDHTFKAVHPEAARHYDDFVGTYWNAVH